MAAKIDNLPFCVEGAQYTYPQERSGPNQDVYDVVSVLSKTTGDVDGVLQFYVEIHNVAKMQTPLLGETFRTVASLSPIDFLAQLEAFGRKTPNDSGIENGLIYHGLRNEMRSSKAKKSHALIVNPPVGFVKCLRENRWPLNHYFTVCTEKDLVAKIYRMEPPLRELSFTTVEKLPAAGGYTHALVFATRMDRGDVLRVLKKVFEKAPAAKVHVVLPAAYLRGRGTDDLRAYLYNENVPEHILVIDPKATHVEPKKRCVLSYGKKVEDVTIQKADLGVDQTIVTGKQYIMERGDLASSSKPLHQLVSDLEKASSGQGLNEARTRRRPFIYTLSKWIQLQYRKERRSNNRFRVLVSYTSVGTKEQRRKNLSGRGNQVGKVFYSTEMTSELEVLPFVESVLWSNEMYEIIQKDVLANLEKNELDFLSLWYLLRPFLKQRRPKGFNDSLCQELFTSSDHNDPLLSLSLGEMGLERIRSALAASPAFNKQSKDIQDKMKNQLLVIIKEACSQHFCASNPLQELNEEWERKRKAMADFRNAMVSRGIENESRKRLEDYLSQAENEKVAAIIDLKALNGLETPVIGALTLGDVSANAKFLDFPVIRIDKQLEGSGTNWKSFASIEQNRILPIPDRGTAFMRYYQKTLENAENEYNKELRRSGETRSKKGYLSWPLFPDKYDMKLPMTKNALNRLIKKAKDAMSIEKDVVHIVGGEEVDINDYGGDIFRADYQRRLRALDVLEGDMQYLTGIKVRPIWCANYRDYLHSSTQIGLHGIQNRSANLQIADDYIVDTSEKEFAIARSSKKEIVIDGGPVRIDALLKVPIPSDVRIKGLRVSVRTRHAMDITATYNPKQ